VKEKGLESVLSTRVVDTSSPPAPSATRIRNSKLGPTTAGKATPGISVTNTLQGTIVPLERLQSETVPSEQHSAVQ